MRCAGQRINMRRYVAVMVSLPLLMELFWLLYFLTSEQNLIPQLLENRSRDVTAQISLHQLKTFKQKEQIRLSEHDKRRAIMDSECRKIHKYPRSNNRALIYNKAHNLMYCEVPKVGSTFWIRFLHQLRANTTASPFAIKPQSVTDLKVNDKWKDKNVTMGDSTNFLFVRNPFHRLFSAYIDKLFSPNPYYWSLLGKYIIQKFRGKTSHCGHDVTFQEFLQYAVHSETTHEKQNNHVMSLWQLCSPCQVKYNIIGKMESFKNDTESIMDKLHLDRYKHILKNMSVDASNDALGDTAQAYIVMRSRAHSCISPEEAADRIWTKLKVRGFIDIDQPVPYGLNQKNEKQVLDIFKDANRRSVSKVGYDGLKRQQHAIFKQAFRKISRKTIEDIKVAFDMDFTIFGYDKHLDLTYNESKDSNVFISNTLF
ncbi:carbohydrate sulfotransferase 10-like [Pecten maximus]|uniref:carbohydrate sulfotransferase 10-like n=1 Tax=Pecten maximus TaxID=6579 RepID=UPI001458ED27|nr:carbohydrate sulfotransferase 10-like [Pecten maximus]